MLMSEWRFLLGASHQRPVTPIRPSLLRLILITQNAISFHHCVVIVFLFQLISDLWGDPLRPCPHLLLFPWSPRFGFHWWTLPDSSLPGCISVVVTSLFCHTLHLPSWSFYHKEELSSSRQRKFIRRKEEAGRLWEPRMERGACMFILQKLQERPGKPWIFGTRSCKTLKLS